MASRLRPAWILGTVGLSVAKIIENMEIGHNVMHGQWDWMNDPHIHSSTWDWDTASPAAAWKHSHNYVHHTYTNVIGKDKDVGYDIMRVDPAQPWYPFYLLQPLYNVLLMAFFEWGVAIHDLDLKRFATGRSRRTRYGTSCAAIGRKARRQIVKDYIAFPALSGRRDSSATLVGEPDRERRPQRLVQRDHLLRALPRPGVHLHRGGGRRREPRRLVRPPAARRRQHRRQRLLPLHERQPQLPGRASPLPGHAELALQGDRAEGEGRSASATGSPTTRARS